MEDTGCITLSFTHSIEHLPEPCATERVTEKVGHHFYSWLNSFTDVKRLQYDPVTITDDGKHIEITETIELPDTDDSTVQRAIAVTQIAEDSMHKAIADKEQEHEEYVKDYLGW